MDGPAIYWSQTSESGGVYFCTPGDPTGDTKMHAEPGSMTATWGDMHYLMSESKDSIFECEKTARGGSPATFISGELGLTSMAVGCTGVYWTVGGTGTSADGAVKMCPLDGCGAGPRIIASGQARPTSITLRNGLVYWTNRGLEGSAASSEVLRARL
ncbi:hypothetical protein [Sorangium cellulosum]|uniref:hypothetical protein n=1 Tax=Sorangium cellulosum TaxID=56 RepID=UPI00133115A0|nr:hypothetical protein [Sorangium cellulosum]